VQEIHVARKGCQGEAASFVGLTRFWTGQCKFLGFSKWLSLKSLFGEIMIIERDYDA
jgi:hypothetical protein